MKDGQPRVILPKGVPVSRRRRFRDEGFGTKGLTQILLPILSHFSSILGVLNKWF